MIPPKCKLHSDVEWYKDSHPLVIKPALREGRTVYEAACKASSY